MGQRRKRDATLFAAYDLDGVRNVEQIRRLVEVAVSDLLEADRGIPRAKAMLSAAKAASDLWRAEVLGDGHVVCIVTRVGSEHRRDA